jgi:hypothetical protein
VEEERKRSRQRPKERETNELGLFLMMHESDKGLERWEEDSCI